MDNSSPFNEQFFSLAELNASIRENWMPTTPVNSRKGM